VWGKLLALAGPNRTRDSVLKKLVESIGLILVGGALALVGQRVVLLDTELQPMASDTAARPDLRERRLALMEEELKSDLRLAVAGFLRLIEFRDFAFLGADVSVVVPVSSSADREDILAAGARGGIRVPGIVVDTAARREWVALGQKLEQAGGGVDPGVFQAFEEIRQFLGTYPMPSRFDLGTVSRSAWARSAVVDRWVVLNRSLSARAVSLLSQFNAGL
jgi:hypothetical protein